MADRLSSGGVQVFSNSGVIAALKRDGSAVTWGIAGEISVAGALSQDYLSRRYQLQSSVASVLISRVTKIFFSDSEFAALKSDGSVITWK